MAEEEFRKTRFSDDTLIKFHQDFQDHVERFNKHERDEKKQHNELLGAQAVNTRAITQLTESVRILTDDTREIINTYKDWQGTFRVGNSVQRFSVWLMKWGLIGTGLAAGIQWLVKFFSH